VPRRRRLPPAEAICPTTNTATPTKKFLSDHE
jgi:hypothetical protein